MPISSPIQIFPNDIKPNIGIGINIPFDKPGVFTPNYQTKDAIRNNLINFFLTNTGERFMNPLFGGGLKSFLFEQLSEGNVSSLQTIVQDKLNKFFSRINIIELLVIPNENDNLITVFLKYSILNTDMVDDITIDFNQ